MAIRAKVSTAGLPWPMAASAARAEHRPGLPEKAHPPLGFLQDRKKERECRHQARPEVCCASVHEAPTRGLVAIHASNWRSGRPVIQTTALYLASPQRWRCGTLLPYTLMDALTQAGRGHCWWGQWPTASCPNSTPNSTVPWLDNLGLHSFREFFITSHLQGQELGHPLGLGAGRPW